MTNKMPSMVALLGLLAVAGYKNRDKIKEMLGKSHQTSGNFPGPQDQQGLEGGVRGKLGGLLAGGSASSVFGGGLRELVDRFKQSGHAETADSWVKTGPNQPIGSDHLEQVIGPEVLSALAEQTGLSREELLDRLTREVPSAVDGLTPNGRLPTDEEAGLTI
ncbi:MAG: YidB family protein [Lysobacteraceae bacterium]